LVPAGLEGDRHHTPTEAELAAQLKSMAELRRAVAAMAEASCLRRLKDCERSLRAQPDEPALHQTLARETLGLGHIYSTTSRPAEAAQAYRRALVELETLAEQHPARPDYRLELAEAYRGLAAVLRATGRATEASEFDRRAAALVPASPDLESQVPEPRGRAGHGEDRAEPSANPGA
jgi:tetratricopeptide (TPR) repeat protein